MEINIENAFAIFVKASLDPFLTFFESLSQNIQAQSYHFALALLKKPLLSSILITCFIVMLMSVLSLSCIILSAVFCAVIMIVICEGCVVVLILILVIVISVSLMGFVTLTSGIQMIYQKHMIAENNT